MIFKKKNETAKYIFYGFSSASLRAFFPKDFVR